MKSFFYFVIFISVFFLGLTFSYSSDNLNSKLDDTKKLFEETTYVKK